MMIFKIYCVRGVEHAFCESLYLHQLLVALSAIIDRIGTQECPTLLKRLLRKETRLIPGLYYIST